MEARFAFFFQRAGGCCKPVEDASGPLFGATGESRRVIAFILCFERPFFEKAANWVVSRKFLSSHV